MTDNFPFSSSQALFTEFESLRIDVEISEIPISAISVDDSPRIAGENLDHIATLAATDAVLPPILVHRQTNRVLDGMHRLRAAQLQNKKSLPACFIECDEADAFVIAVKANITHGLPLTLEDREAAAARIIQTHPQRSDRWIAGMTGLAASTVRKLRADTRSQPTKRMGRDGRVRPTNIADGRLKASDEILKRPDASLREIAKAAGVSPTTAKDVRDRLRRGENPVPGQVKDTPSAQASPDEPIYDNEAARYTYLRNLSLAVKKLQRDPSLRYTESGRVLMQWLQTSARGPALLENLLGDVPPHCGYIIADIARTIATEWQEFATDLEQRLRNWQASTTGNLILGAELNGVPVIRSHCSEVLS